MKDKSPIAVTVASRGYMAMAKESMRRTKEFTGLDTRLIVTGKDDAFGAKLSLDKDPDLQRPILFVDADLWFLRKWEPQPIMTSGVWAGCHDSAVWNPWSFAYKDCHQNGLDRFKYLNSGMFMCDLSLKEHRKVFQRARRSFDSGKSKTFDKTDQYHLNRGLCESGLPITFLHPRFNLYTLASVWGQCASIPREIVGLHAAGVPLKHKHDVLKAEASVFGRPHHPMCQDAVNWHFSKAHELP